MNAANNDPTAGAGTPGVGRVTTTQVLPDEHRRIASEWMARVLEGVREMHQNERARQAVARRLF
ncbi:hypothetical protein [Caballeronia sp. dw_19]|uniref:hypothetical protein n=1 Tax=Caballeronia sp. dw_19 TaxID=2719791 RepID=UPI001BD2CF52|nr:hypothetical protein [Caballeronia sp. dw_19]